VIVPPAKRKPTAAELEQLRATILEFHAEGVSRNEIMRRTGQSGRMVTGTIQAAGLTFARSPEVVAATEARQVDLAALRSQLAIDLTQDAIRLRKQLWQPHLYWDWGGKDHDYDARTQPEPTAADKRALLGAAGLAIDRSLKLSPPAAENGADAARSMLSDLAAGIRRLAGEDPAAEEG
jgi:hypothetical protein